MKRRSQWVTGQSANRSGISVYVEMIRAPGDPARRPRYKGQDRAPHLSIDKVDEAVWMERIAAHLAGGEGRTLNRIGVEMIDKTADVVAFTRFGNALWRLVFDRRVEHTMRAPILFRMVTK